MHFISIGVVPLLRFQVYNSMTQSYAAQRNTYNIQTINARNIKYYNAWMDFAVYRLYDAISFYHTPYKSKRSSV